MQILSNKEGLIYGKQPGTAIWIPIALPAGIEITQYRGTPAKTRRTTVLNGRWSRGLIWYDEFGVLRRLGIEKPTVAPTVAVNGVGITASVIMYYSWVEKIGARVVHQGNLSVGAAINLVDQGVRTTVPAAAADARTTHIRLWASVDGANPRFVSDTAIGATTLDWNGPVSAIVNTETPPVNGDGSLLADARGVPPYSRFCVTYHHRTFYFGDPEYPHRAWFSLIDEPESVSPTSYRDAKGRQALTGGGVWSDQLMLFHHNGSYDVQGYSESDIAMRGLPGKVGCISHHSIVNGEDGRLFFAAQDGPTEYAGHFRNLVRKTLRGYWVGDYAANRAIYQDAVGLLDQEWGCYILLIPKEEAFYYVGQYLQLNNANGLPAWMFDTLTRKDNAMGVLYDPGSQQEDYYVGSCDGYIRKTNVDWEDTDDEDANEKRAILRTKHYYFGDQSGTRKHGKRVLDLDLYILSWHQGYTVAAYGGDDNALEATVPTWGPYDFPALAHASGIAPDTSKKIKPRGLAGKGVTIEITVDAPVGFEYRGISMGHGAGSQVGPRTT